MRRSTGSLCRAGVCGLLLLAAPSTAYAADTGVSGRANAVQVTVLGQAADSGVVEATNDGTGETRTGTVSPPLSVLPDQMVASIGVLAQDATAGDDGDGQACAGVAGDGGSVVEIGDSGCLTPGANIDLELAQLDLSSVLEGEVVSGSGTLATLLGALGAGQLATVVDTLQSAVDQVEAQLGNAVLRLDADAVQGMCAANPDQVTGRAVLADAGVRLVVPGVGEVPLDLPDEPAANTSLTARTGQLSVLLTAALTDSLGASLGTIEDPLINLVLVPLAADVVGAAVQQLTPALDDLDGLGILQVVLNEQETTVDGIELTALHATALEAMAQLGAPTVADVALGNVACSPYALAPGDGGGTDDPTDPVDPEEPVVPVTDPAAPTVAPVTDPAGDPADPAAGSPSPQTDTAGAPVPTAVDAGVASTSAAVRSRLLPLLAAAVVALGGAALARTRRTTP